MSNFANEMSADTITLICLVAGESVEHAFPVSAKLSDLVGALKEQIKQKKANDFQHFDADKLTLYLCNQPIINDQDEPVPLEGASKLSAIAKVSKYFPSQPKAEQIHVIVRPAAAISVAATSQIFTCRAHLKKVKKTFFFEQQSSDDNWQQFQLRVKKSFGGYLQEVDEAAIRIQPKSQDVEISSEEDFVLYMKRNKSGELDFLVLTRKF